MQACIVSWWEGKTTKTFESLEVSDPPEIVSSNGDITQYAKLPEINPDNLIKYEFVREFDGTPQWATVKKQLKD